MTYKFPYPIHPQPGEDTLSPSFKARVAFVEQMNLAMADPDPRVEAAAQTLRRETGVVIERATGLARVVLAATDEVEAPHLERAKTLTDQWIAVYEDEQANGADHRRILDTLADIRVALAI